MKKHASDVGAYMWYRFNTLNESSKYVVTEMETLDKKLDNKAKLKKMKDKRETAKEAKARNNKKQKTEEDKCGEKTDDQKEMDMEDAADMVFDRNQSWKTENKQIKSDLLHALEVSGSTYKRVDESGHEIYN